MPYKIATLSAGARLGVGSALAELLPATPYATAEAKPARALRREGKYGNQAGLPPQQIAQLSKRARVDHVICCEPGPPGLVDAEAHVPKRIDGMGIRRNRELDAGFLRRVGMDVVEIEPLWLGVDLEMQPHSRAAAMTRSMSMS